MLAGLGAEVVEGDLEDRPSIERALEDVHGAFSVRQFFEAGLEGEIRQGKALEDGAKAAGFSHFVCTPVGSAHFESKWGSRSTREIRLPYTVLRPVYFVQNREMMRDPILGGTLSQPHDPDKPFQMVGIQGIGVFAALAFKNPEEWIGREVDPAGDELTMPEVAAAFSRVTGRQTDYFQVPWDRFEEQMGEEYAVMYLWFNDRGCEADIPA